VLLIPCPFCGPRDESEFKYGAESGVAMPAGPAAQDDAAWGEWVFVRSNPKGPLDERWYHSHGCRRWFTLRRDTSTDEILSGPTPIGWPKPPRGSLPVPGSTGEPGAAGAPPSPGSPPAGGARS
jgi:heterotetrameric sarcosine oxidase delta subunit